MAGDAADMDDAFWVRGRCFADFAVFRRVQPAGDGELGATDGVGDVDVEEGVVAQSVGGVGGVFGFGSAGGVPEVGPVRFEDSCSGAYLGRWM